jgi:hypothetical protein
VDSVHGGLGHGRPKGADLGHDGSHGLAEQKEGCTRSPSRASPGRGRRRGDRATVVKKWWWRSSVWVVLGCREKR